MNGVPGNPRTEMAVDRSPLGPQEPAKDKKDELGAVMLRLDLLDAIVLPLGQHLCALMFELGDVIMPAARERVEECAKAVARELSECKEDGTRCAVAARVEDAMARVRLCCGLVCALRDGISI